MRKLMLIPFVIVVVLVCSVLIMPVSAGEVTQSTVPTISLWADSGNFVLQPCVTQSARLGVIHPLILPSTIDIRRQVEEKLNSVTIRRIRRANDASGSVPGGHYAVILPMGTLADGRVAIP